MEGKTYTKVCQQCGTTFTAKMKQTRLRESAYYPKGLGGGVVAWNTPYAHYQYMGELYLAENGSSWAKKYETKYPAGRPLHYGYPGTGDHCFETAKETHKEEWTNIVRREVGKG